MAVLATASRAALGLTYLTSAEDLEESRVPVCESGSESVDKSGKKRGDNVDVQVEATGQT